MTEQMTREELDRLEHFTKSVQSSRDGQRKQGKRYIGQSQIRLDFDVALSLISLARQGLDAGWRDIEEAPKDGTEVLLLSGGSAVVGYFCTAKEWPSSEAGFNDWTVGTANNGQYDCGFVRIASPTHWKSLPTPPEGA